MTYALQRGIDHVGSVGGSAHTKQHRLCGRVVVRCAFTIEVGQKQRCVGMHAAQLGFLEQFSDVSFPGEAGREVQAGCSGQHHRHQMPGAGQGVAETVNRLRGVGSKAIHRDKKDAGCSQGKHGLARLNHPGTERTRSVVAGARNNRNRLETKAARNIV